jgi:hypothetical protein
MAAVVQLHDEAAVRRGSLAATSAAGGAGTLQARPVGMHSNACAAATAALLALAGQGGPMAQAISQELGLQMWRGQSVQLPGLEQIRG